MIGWCERPRTPLAFTFFAVLLAACAGWFQKATTIAADVATCLVSKQDLPDEQALLECGVSEAEKILATEILHKAREESAKKAVVAAEIAAHDTKEKMLATGCKK